jgi:hypothetical protein
MFIGMMGVGLWSWIIKGFLVKKSCAEKRSAKAKGPAIFLDLASKVSPFESWKVGTSKLYLHSGWCMMSLMLIVAAAQKLLDQMLVLGVGRGRFEKKNHRQPISS